MKTWLKLAIAILVYNSIFMCFCIYKYFHYLYNGLDLAIYTNALHNIINGNGVWSSIQMQNYFGDHFEPFLFVIAPIYNLFQSPITLLIIQTIVLSLSIIPIYLISKKYFDEKKSFIISIIWLLMPFLHNINSFEFHILSFAVPLIAFTYYAYQKNNLFLFFVTVVLSLLVREDVALLIIMFGLLAWIDKKPLIWKLFPTIAGFLYFFTTTHFIGRLSDGGSYKFLMYYGWVCPSTTPWEIVAHILHPQNIIFIFVLLSVFIFLPIFRIKTLVLIIPILLQFILQNTTHAWIILSSHYTALLLPILFIASVQGYSKTKDSNGKISKYLSKNKELLPILIIITIVYTNIVLGPLFGLIKADYSIKKQIYDDVLSSIIRNQKESINATLTAIPYFSNIKNVFSHHYTFLGRSQFGIKEYTLPNDPDYHVIDFDDYFYYQNSFKNNPAIKKYWSEATNNIKNILDTKKYSVEKCINSLCVFKKGGDYNMSYFYEASDFTSEKDFDTTITKQNENDQFLDIKVKYQQKKQDNNTKFAEIIYEKNGHEIYSSIIPINYGFKNSDEWEENSSYINSYRIYKPNGLISIKFRVFTASGYETIGPLRETVHAIKNKKILYETVLKN